MGDGNNGGQQNGGGGGFGRGGGNNWGGRRRGATFGSDEAKSNQPKEVAREMITTGRDFIIPKSDPHAAGIFYIIIPAGALGDGATRLDDLNQNNKTSTWTYSALLNWIRGSFKDLGLVGQKMKYDPLVKEYFGDLGEVKDGRPNEAGTANPGEVVLPHHYANRQPPPGAAQVNNRGVVAAAGGSNINRGFAGGRDPGIHPPERTDLPPAYDVVPTVPALVNELPPGYTPAAGPGVEPPVPIQQQFATVTDNAMGEDDDGEVVRVVQPQPPPQQPQNQQQNEGPPKYIHSAYFIRNQGVTQATGSALTPKIRTSVIPLYEHFPDPQTPVNDCCDQGKNLKGYLLTFVKLDPNFDTSEFLSLFIKKVAKRLNRSMLDYADLIGEEKTTVKRRSAKNMGYTGDLTQDHIDGPKIKNTKANAGSSTDNFLRTPKHAHELLYVNYPSTLRMLIENANPELQHEQFNQEYKDHWEKPPNAFAMFTDEKNEKLDISILRNWKFVEKCLKLMKVCPEQIPDNPWPQTGDYNYPENVLGFTIPAHYAMAFTKAIFPSKAILRFVMGSGQQALVRDVERLQDPTMADLEILSKETNVSTETMPRKGELAELYLPHEQIANYHMNNVLLSREALKNGDPKAKEALRNHLKAIIQDNELKVNDPNIQNSRHVKNCNEYLHLMLIKKTRMVDTHPVAEGFGFVGQYLIHINAKLSELGVDRSQLVVLILFLSGCSPAAMGYFDFAKIVALSIMLCGHPSTGKSFALAAASQLMVPGSFEEFQNTTAAGAKAFSKDLDMVAHFVSEAQKVLTEPLKNLKGDEMDTRRLFQTILSEQAVYNKKFQTIHLPDGSTRDVPYNEQMLIRTVISGAKNQISLLKDINSDPLFNRCIQVCMACLSAELDDPERPPLDRIDPVMGNHLIEFTRKIQCISVLVWTRFISTKLIPKPSTKLYHLMATRVKRCPLFIEKPDRTVGSVSIMYAVLLVQAAVFNLLGNLSPLLSHRLSNTIPDSEIDKIFNLPDDVVAEFMEEVHDPFYQELLAGLAGNMTDNREAAVATLSFIYLWDMPVMFMLSQIMAAKGNAHGEFLRRCVQLKDRSMISQMPGAFGARFDDEKANENAMSHLYSWKFNKHFATNLEFSRYFYSEEDNGTFLKKLSNDAQNKRTPNGNNILLFEPGTQEYKISKLACLIQIITNFNSIIYILHEPIHFRKLLHGGVQQARESHEFFTMKKHLSLENEIDFDAAKIRGVNELVANCHQTQDYTDVAKSSYLKPLCRSFATNLHYLKEVQTLVNYEELKSLIMKTDDQKTLNNTLMVLQSKKLKFKELYTSVLSKEVGGSGGGSTDYFGKLYLPQSADDIIPKHKMPRFKVEANGMINPNYIEFVYGTDQNLFFMIHSMLGNAHHKLKDLNLKEVYYYIDAMTQVKMKHPVLPHYDASHFVNPTAKFIGGIFDPANFLGYSEHESQLLFYDNSKSHFSNEDAGGVPVFSADGATYTHNAVATDSASGSTSTASNNASLGNGGRINPATNVAGGNATGNTNAKNQQKNGGATGSDGAKKGPKKNKAFLLTHYFLMDQQYFFDKFMETIGSENTTEGIPVVGIFPSRKDVRMHAVSHTRKGVAPTSFANPSFRNPKLKKASKGRAAVINGIGGEVRVNPLYDPPFNASMDNLRIDLGTQDEETEFNDAFAKENGIKGKAGYPETIRAELQKWCDSLISTDKVLQYPEDYSRDFSSA